MCSNLKKKNHLVNCTLADRSTELSVGHVCDVTGVLRVCVIAFLTYFYFLAHAVGFRGRGQ